MDEGIGFLGVSAPARVSGEGSFVSEEWDELECWLDAGGRSLSGDRIVAAMQSSGWRPPARVIKTVEELWSLPYDAVLHWIDDAGLPHVQFQIQLMRSESGPMWSMTVLFEGGSDV